MSIRPIYTALGQTFGDYLFAAPRYQRGYTWDEDEVQDFLDDLTKCFRARRANSQREHFLGGVVGVEETVEGSVTRRCQLIDGQQRVTTFVLVARALELSLQELLSAGQLGQHAAFVREAAEDLRKSYLRARIQVNRVYRDEERLTPSEPDRGYCAAILHQPPEDAATARESHKRLSRALELARTRVKELLAAETSRQRRADAVGALTDVLRSDLTVILILPSDPADAYRLFQVLNDRGTNLSEGDLLRARSLEMLSGAQGQQEHESVAEIWDEILAERPADTEKFLRCYYSSVRGQRPGQASLFDDFVAAFFPPFTGAPLTQPDRRKLVQAITALRGEFRRYRQLVEGVWPFPAPTRTTPAEKDRLPQLVRVLDHELCHPLLLAACVLGEERFRDVVQLTERIAFRYKYICNSHVTSLTNVYLRQAKAMRDGPVAYRLRDLQSAYHDVQERKTTTEAFRSGFGTRLVYQEAGGNRPLKYFLLTAEHYWRWFDEGAQGRPKCHDPNRLIDPETTTIEHIHSQNAGGGPSPLDALTNDLGNLTLLSQPDNERVANRAFADKQTVYGESAFTITQPLGAAVAWDQAAIEAWKAKLLAFAEAFFVITAPPADAGAGAARRGRRGGA